MEKTKTKNLFFENTKIIFIYSEHIQQVKAL